jgi:hypothetical protein
VIKSAQKAQRNTAADNENFERAKRNADLALRQLFAP